MEGKPDWLSGFPVQIYCNRSDGRLPYEKQLSPPQAALDSAAPYRGGFIGGSPFKASPARGGVCAARRRRRGALPVSGKNILQGPAGPCPAPVGDDARIVPETLRWRKGPAAGEIARPTKPPRAGSNAQTPAIRQACRGGLRHPGRALARQGAASLRRLGRHYRFAVPASRCVC